jgi:uncharacterized HAD superfamily protein
MEYSPGTEDFKTFIKIYSDDFIRDYILLTNDNQPLDITKTDNLVKGKINKYMNERVELYADNVKIEGQVRDYESSEGEIRVNLFYHTGKKPRIFRVKCGILTDIYSDQANFLIFRYDDFEEGVKLTPENKEQTFEIK